MSIDMKAATAWLQGLLILPPFLSSSVFPFSSFTQTLVFSAASIFMGLWYLTQKIIPGSVTMGTAATESANPREVDTAADINTQDSVEKHADTQQPSAAPAWGSGEHDGVPKFSE